MRGVIKWAVSSEGERRLDRTEVAGSIPAPPTILVFAIGCDVAPHVLSPPIVMLIGDEPQCVYLFKSVMRKLK